MYCLTDGNTAAPYSGVRDLGKTEGVTKTSILFANILVQFFSSFTSLTAWLLFTLHKVPSFLVQVALESDFPGRFQYPVIF